MPPVAPASPYSCWAPSPAPVPTPCSNSPPTATTSSSSALIDSSVPATGDGKSRALAIAAPRRSPLAPDLPTMAEAGLPGYEFQSWYGVWAPKGTPAEIEANPDSLTGQYLSGARAIEIPAERRPGNGLGRPRRCMTPDVMMFQS